MSIDIDSRLGIQSLYFGEDASLTATTSDQDDPLYIYSEFDMGLSEISLFDKQVISLLGKSEGSDFIDLYADFGEDSLSLFQVDALSSSLSGRLLLFDLDGTSQDVGSIQISTNVAAVPLPASSTLIMAAIGLLFCWRRQR